MASRKSKNYGLNLWEPEDSFTHTEFNENSEKIDTALGTCASTLSAHESTIKSNTTKLGSLTTTVNSHTTSISAHETALGTLNTQVTQQAATLASQATSLNRLDSGAVKLAYGSYSGGGGKSRSFPASFTPVLLVVTGSSSVAVVVRGMNAGNISSGPTSSRFLCSWESKSVTLTSVDSVLSLDQSGTTYGYFMLG